MKNRKDKDIAFDYNRKGFCFKCNCDIYKGDYFINKKIEINNVRGFFNIYKNRTTTLENILVCEDCLHHEIDDMNNRRDSWINIFTIVLTILISTCFLFWFEVFKEFSKDLKLLWCFRVTFISIFLIFIIIFAKSKEDKVYKFLSN